MCGALLLCACVCRLPYAVHTTKHYYDSEFLFQHRNHIYIWLTSSCRNENEMGMVKFSVKWVFIVNEQRENLIC